LLRTYYQILKENKYLGNCKKQKNGYIKNIFVQSLIEDCNIEYAIETEIYNYCNEYINNNEKILKIYFLKLDYEDIIYEIQKMTEYILNKIQILLKKYKPFIIFSIILQTYISKKKISIGQLMNSIDKNYGIIDDEVSAYFIDSLKSQIEYEYVNINKDMLLEYISKKLINKHIYLE
jgi:hypothetical protein